MAIYLRKRVGTRFDAPFGGPIYCPGSMAGRPDPANLWGGYSTGLGISVYLLSALLVWGGIGYLIDRLAGTGRVFTAVGMVVGAVAGIYLIYLRYGRGEDARKR